MRAITINPERMAALAGSVPPSRLHDDPPAVYKIPIWARPVRPAPEDIRTSLQPLGAAKVLVEFVVYSIVDSLADIEVTGAYIGGDLVPAAEFSDRCRGVWHRACRAEVEQELRS